MVSLSVEQLLEGPQPAALALMVVQFLKYFCDCSKHKIGSTAAAKSSACTNCTEGFSSDPTRTQCVQCPGMLNVLVCNPY